MQMNWAGNYFYRAGQIFEPKSLEEIQDIVVRSPKVKALGTRHSFNDIADSAGSLISLKHLNGILEIDHEHRTVTVDAGVRYGELCGWLEHRGYALHNLASLPHISIAGACATATHGSGDGNKNLAAAVSALEFVNAKGELVSLSRDQGGEKFKGAVVSLGGLGIVTRLTLEVSPSFQMQQDVYEHLSFDQLENHFDEISSCGYSVSLFTAWRSSSFDQVWIKRQTPGGVPIRAQPELFGTRLATRALHPIASLSAENCTGQLGVCGPWHERLPHFRMDFMPSSGEELQSEYILPRGQAISAFHQILALSQAISPLLQISEIRTIAADDLWMSPCYQQDCVAIHFTWKKDWEGVRQVLPLLEERLTQFDARPHWGKLFTMEPNRLQSLYQKLPEFRQLLRHYDPDQKFSNEFLDRFIFGNFDQS